jgi:hypothetical protein
MIISPFILGFAALWVLVYGGGNSRAIGVVTGDADALARSYAPMNRHIMSDSHPSHAYKRAQVVTGTTVTDTSGEGGGDELEPVNPGNEGGTPVLVLPREFNDIYLQWDPDATTAPSGVIQSDVQYFYGLIETMDVEAIQAYADGAAEYDRSPYTGEHETDAAMVAVLQWSKEHKVNIEISPP